MGTPQEPCGLRSPDGAKHVERISGLVSEERESETTESAFSSAKGKASRLSLLPLGEEAAVLGRSQDESHPQIAFLHPPALLPALNPAPRRSAGAQWTGFSSSTCPQPIGCVGSLALILFPWQWKGWGERKQRARKGSPSRDEIGARLWVALWLARQQVFIWGPWEISSWLRPPAAGIRGRLHGVSFHPPTSSQKLWFSSQFPPRQLKQWMDT